MTTITMPVPTKISRESTSEDKFTELRVSFGDGYSQAAPDGINAVKEVWNIQWIALTEAERTTVRNALRSVGTWGNILWTPCNESIERKFQVQGTVKYGKFSKNLFTVSCQLIEDFRL